jgi:glycosyltransferase involved in cell wall biosynthesis
VRVALYNAHWPTFGGGEQLAAGVAAVLGEDHDLELLVVEEFDARAAAGRLGFDLSGLPQRVIVPGTAAFLEASAEYELFVNTSFANMHASRARRSLYYVHFPAPHEELSAGRRRVARLVGPLLDPLAPWLERSVGFWMREFPGYGCWTKGRARIDLVLPRGVRLPFGLQLDARHWPPGRTPHVTVRVGGVIVHDGPAGREPVRLTTSVVGRGVDDPIPVDIESDTFVPRLAMGLDDDRTLGVIVSHVHLGRRRPSLPRLLVAPLARYELAPFVPEFLDSYQVVAANSEYTAGWVERLWGREATVLPPPVRLREPGEKDRVVLSVGRFFRRQSGHSKKQLELVHAFRLACEAGLAGWELHLVGGCSNAERGYVEEVRRAAAGLPVTLHVNARAEELAVLFERASVFWHAAGLGENAELHPDRLEHFGISVVEAMSAGIVPFVYALGGPAAIVAEPEFGRTFATVEQLAARTVELVRRPDALSRLAAAARARATEFGLHRFADRLRSLVGELCDTPSSAEPSAGR